jgi:DnaJ-class molecular chaperone
MRFPLTEERACGILKVRLESTHREIKAAYHSMANQWHPDRRGSESVAQQRLANQQMAAINEAYCLLRSAQASRH